MLFKYNLLHQGLPNRITTINIHFFPASNAFDMINVYLRAGLHYAICVTPSFFNLHTLAKEIIMSQWMNGKGVVCN